MALWKELKEQLHRIFYPPGTTPMQWKIHSVNFTALFSSCLIISMVFPYLPAMVKSWGVSEEDAGYYAGIVASMMFTGRIFGSYLWGWLADKYGRRPVLLTTLVLLFLGTAAFGFTTSFAWAVVTRLFIGVTNGAVGTCKAVVSDLCDDTNQGLGVSFLMTSWNLGLILGPALGGFLSEPSRKFPHVFPPGSFLDKFAFLLPPLSNCLVLLIAIFAVYFAFPETYDPKSGHRILTFGVDGAEDDRILSSSTETQAATDLHCTGKENSTGNNQIEETGGGRESITVNLQSSEHYTKRRTRKRSEVRVDEAIEMNDIETQPGGEFVDVTELMLTDKENRSMDIRVQPCCHGCCNTCRCLRKSKLLKICRNRDAIMAILVYCIFSFAVIGLDELFSLWSATTPALGGLGFTTDNIGTALLMVSVPLVFLNMLLFHKVERRFGGIRSFQICTVISSATCFALPFINHFYDRSTVLWSLLFIIMLPLKLAIGCGFACTTILVNNSVPPKLLASVNGLAMTLTSITRALASISGGSIYAWSINSGINIGFPFDEHFTFIVFSLVFLASLLLSFALPERINQQKQTSGS